MQAQILQILDAADYEQEILRGVELLLAGRLIVLPTETVYGVAGVLTNPQARAALREMRQSPNRPFTVHVADNRQAAAFIDKPSPFAARAMRKLWPGPIGLIFDVSPERRQAVVGKLGLEEADIYEESRITLRCPDHAVFMDVVSRIADPVALVAARGERARMAEPEPDVLGKVEMVFDAGTTRFAHPSTLVHIGANKYDVIRPGVYDRRIIDRMLRTTVLFVCSGNTCRSPMAEAIASRILADKLGVRADALEDRGVNVISAGSFALPGSRATAEAVEAVRDTGVDLSRHRSQTLTVELIHQADWIFTMSRSHAAAVLALAPSASGRVLPLDSDGDIKDPIGGDAAMYQEVAGKIRRAIEKRMTEFEIP